MNKKQNELRKEKENSLNISNRILPIICDKIVVLLNQNNYRLAEEEINNLKKEIENLQSSVLELVLSEQRNK